MQPEPFAISPSNDSSDLRQAPSITSQHGSHDREDGAARPAASDIDVATGGVASPLSNSPALDATPKSALPTSIGRRESPQRRLKSPNPPSPPAYNRIVEYENALSPAPKRRQGPVFEVIKKPGNSGDKRSLILELPNGRY
jgi:hypothetical protein